MMNTRIKVVLLVMGLAVLAALIPAVSGQPTPGATDPLRKFVLQPDSDEAAS